ncbi:MAG TPA: VWA domain-containing protein [Anaerolineae bacterium]|nr:VWA domain-containing protein [Anaerolineae bacterium]
MALLWPGFLLLLGLVPLIVAVYIWMLRRRRHFAVRYSSLALVRAALPHPSRLRRHLPFALFLLALASLVIALGRPVAIVSVPTGQTTIILAIDVSRSMCSTDIEPNRLEAAKAAALSFIQRQPFGTQIGIVAFAGFAALIQPPTTDQEVLQDAIESLAPARRTAIGSAVLKSLDAIAEIDPNVAPSVTDTSPGVEPTPVPQGAYAPEIVVLLTDGASNVGPFPSEAAQQAADRGVRVYTIGFGTANEFNPFGGPRCQGGDPFGGGQPFGGGGQFGGGGFRRGIDEATLKQVADMTGGTYYAAESADELQSVFENLPTYLILKHETTEISVAFTAIGALLAAMAIVLSQIWHPLP